jgi:pimeloyl-ACP methyl ester carboxylesterase
MIKTVEYIEVNNKKQCLSIRANHTNNPILLYLHGGPGDAALPLVAKYNKRLEDIFTVVTLEQRGAGKSYYPFSENEDIKIGTFLDDIHALSLNLLKRFNQEKLYLAGHSWGSILGIRFIQLHPDIVHTYVGCGQVVNMIKSSRAAYDYAMQKNRESKNDKTISKLESIDCSYRGESWLNDLLFVTGQVVKHKGSLYGKTNYNRFIFDFLTSPDYSLRDLLNRQKGSLQSIKYLWQELMTTNFEEETEFKVPVVFVEGRHDHHVCSSLAYEYFESIKSAKQFHWFEKSCHFPQWSEPQKFYEVMASVINSVHLSPSCPVPNARRSR